MIDPIGGVSGSSGPAAAGNDGAGQFSPSEAYDQYSKNVDEILSNQALDSKQKFERLAENFQRFNTQIEGSNLSPEDKQLYLAQGKGKYEYAQFDVRVKDLLNSKMDSRQKLDRLNESYQRFSTQIEGSNLSPSDKEALLAQGSQLFNNANNQIRNPQSRPFGL